MKLAKISTLETEELACYITGLDYDEIDADGLVLAEVGDFGNGTFNLPPKLNSSSNSQ